MKGAQQDILATLGNVAQRVLLAAALTAASVALAQSGGGYDLHWNKAAAGGVAMSGAGAYTINGSVAQADASPVGALNGGNGYVVHGGFWAGVHENDVIFRNGFEVLP